MQLTCAAALRTGPCANNLLRARPAAGRRCFSGESRRGARGTGAHHQAVLERCNDARTGMPFGMPKGAMCVQRFDDSLNSAIHTTYRISLRSSSMPEPRDPLLKVLISYCVCFAQTIQLPQSVWLGSIGGRTRRGNGKNVLVHKGGGGGWVRVGDSEASIVSWPWGASPSSPYWAGTRKPPATTFIGPLSTSRGRNPRRLLSRPL